MLFCSVRFSGLLVMCCVLGWWLKLVLMCSVFICEVKFGFLIGKVLVLVSVFLKLGVFELVRLWLSVFCVCREVWVLVIVM